MSTVALDDMTYPWGRTLFVVVCCCAESALPALDVYAAAQSQTGHVHCRNLKTLNISNAVNLELETH